MTKTKADLSANSGRNELNAKKAFRRGSRSKTDNGLFTKAYGEKTDNGLFTEVLGAKPITGFSRRLTEKKSKRKRTKEKN